MEPKYYILKYKIGDISGDGHERMESGFIHVNYSNEELKNAMKTFKEKTGCVWENWFKKYEECMLSKEDTDKVLEYLGPSKANDFEMYQDCLNIYNGDEFVAFMMAICRVALPDLDWCYHKPKVDGDAFFSGMGYGLF